MTATAPPPADRSPNVVVLSGNLLLASRVRGLVQTLGGRCRIAGKLPDEPEPLTHVFLDLATRSKLTADVPVLCRERFPDAMTVAYGPHVEVDRLAAAREAGFDRVMTNREFDGGVRELLGGS